MRLRYAVEPALIRLRLQPFLWRGRGTVFNRDQFLKLAMACTFVVLTTVSTAARAGDQAQNLEPVGPHEPILTTVGSKRIIAFYEPESGHCALHAVIWNNANADADVSAARVRISLEPGQIVHIDTSENESLNLQCSANAEKLAVVHTDNLVSFGITIQQPEQPVKASASGF
jgi:hypothetical protein